MEKNDSKFYSPLNQLIHNLALDSQQILDDAPPVWSSKKSYQANGAQRKYIFISYSHKDFRIVYRDLYQLWAVNAHYWYDREFRYCSDLGDSSESWKQTAHDIIVNDPNCVGVVFYVSKNSFVSDAVHHEISCYYERKQKDKNFTYLAVLIGGNDIFDIQNQCHLTNETFTSQRMLNIHQLFGNEHLYLTASENYDYLFSITRYFINRGCVNDINFDYAHQVILRNGYAVIGDQLISYYKEGKRFELEEEDIGIVKHITGNAISGASLEEIVIPEGVEEIDDFAIMACPNLKRIYIPKSVKKLSFYALSNFNYRNIEIHPENPNYTVDSNGMVFAKVGNRLTTLVAVPNHNPIKELVLPEGITIINDFVVSNCINLESIIFPSSLLCIGFWSVSNNPALKTITIHPNIQYISENAFHNTAIENLTVIFKGTKEQFESQEKINAKQTLQDVFQGAKIVYEK